jgi:DNA segregation ATPase FtsK/SpoIIIE, S-DNA-T family
VGRMKQQDPTVEFVENAGGAVRGAVTGAWQYRLELGLLAVLATVILYAKNSPALIAYPGLLALLTGVFFARHRLNRLLTVARVKRAWRRATDDCGLHDRCRKVRPCAAGDRLDVRVARGRSIHGLEAKTGELAACLRVREIRVTRDHDDASRANVTLVRRDPFAVMPPVPWPGLQPDATPSVWDPVRVGTTEDGAPLTLRIVGNQILVGGITGGGKSVFMRSLLGTAALDSNAKLWLFDAKLVELAPWAPAAEELVGRDGARAVQVLTHLQRITDERQQEIVASGGDKIRRSSGLPIHVIVIDELAEFAGLKEGQQIMDLVRSIASRGRALGMAGVVATQYPHGSLIDTTLRGQFKTIIGFRCRDRHHGGTIFGQSDLANLVAAIPERFPDGRSAAGIGYALDEGGTTVRFRGVLIGRPDDDDPDRADDVLRVVERAAGDRLTRDLAALPGLPGVPPAVAHTPLGYEGTGMPAMPDKPSPRRGKAHGNGRSPGQVPALLGPLMDRWDGAPMSQSGLARLLDRGPTDGSVRRAIRAAQDQGLMQRNPEGLWIKIVT